LQCRVAVAALNLVCKHAVTSTTGIDGVATLTVGARKDAAWGEGQKKSRKKEIKRFHRRLLAKEKISLQFPPGHVKI